MNVNMNINSGLGMGMGMPMHITSVATQSLRRHQTSLYRQRTYMDHNSMAVTDVIFQEQVSHSSWALTATNPILMTSGGHFIGSLHLPTAAPQPPPPAPPPPPQANYGYMPMPGTYYSHNPGAFNRGFSHIYTARAHMSSSCSVHGFYMPPHVSSQGHSRAATPPTNQGHSRTATPPTNQGHSCAAPPTKNSCDAATQTDLICNVPPLVKLNEPRTTTEVSSPDLATESLNDSSETPINSAAGLETGAGDGIHSPNIWQGGLRNSEVSLPQQHLLDITRISLYGSDVAEKLATSYRSRPCFKKVDTLCARLRQDLLRPDGVLANINSQGVAWAVKDFIFVFTRIVNAWVILKGYVYNTPNGLNKIKDELPLGFMAGFDAWQRCTLTLVQMVIQSFVSLDDVLQKQKSAVVKVDIIKKSPTANSSNSETGSDSSTLGNTCSSPEPVKQSGPSGFSTPKNNNSQKLETDETFDLENSSSGATLTNKSKSGIDLNYLYTLIEDSEQTQRNVDANGTYLKTGTYKPLKKELSERQRPASTPACLPSKTPYTYEQWKRLHQQAVEAVQERPKPEPQRRRADISSYINRFSIVGHEVSRALYEFGNRLMELPNTERFFQKQFTKNYYPDLYERLGHEFTDVRSIILKCEKADYFHVYQAIHDLRRISYVVRKYLKVNNNEDLRSNIECYDTKVNEMLSKPPHEPNQYDHITGRPGEKLFNYEI